jgi:hypothetical protein
VKPKRTATALTGLPPSALGPNAIVWQGNVWNPCPASELDFIGVGRKVRKPHSVKFGHVRADKQNAVIIRGIAPRPPNVGEYKDTVDKFAGLAKTCWWMTDDFSGSLGSYNCYGYVIAREAVEKGENVRVCEPGWEIPPNNESLKAYDTFFGLYGYVRIPEPVGTEIPQLARIAWFSEKHVALRSDYGYKGEDQWESKIGNDGYRILHPLRALEKGLYGDVVHWYRKA